MPDRVIRDDMLDSDRYLGLSSDTARMLFVHFVLVADDLGNAEASDLFIRRRLLPHGTTNSAIATLLSELGDMDLVRVYEQSAVSSATSLHKIGTSAPSVEYRVSRNQRVVA
jgi:hypothetical protein